MVLLAGAGRLDDDTIARRLERQERLGADEAVAGDLLAAYDAFQQKGVIRLGLDPRKGRHWRQVVAQQLAVVVDYVLVDCPPTLGILMVNALAAADFLIIPVQTEFLALKGLERMKSTLAMITRARKITIPTLIVPSLYDRRTRAGRDTLEMLRDIYTDDLWDLVIPIDTQFRDASKKGLPLTALNSHARGVVAFEALLDTILYMRGEEGMQRDDEIKMVQSL